MPHSLQRVGTAAMWALAFVIALISARYFLVPPLWLVPPLPPGPLFHGPRADAVTGIAPHLYWNHRVWLLLHIGSAMLALILGPFQFLAGLRAVHPAVHRALGRVYLTAILVAGSTGLPLSWMALGAHPAGSRIQFYPSAISFGSLSVVWLCVSTMALMRVRQRRFAEHRAWMMRSYSLTFAAVTVRLVAPILLLLIRDPIAAAQLAVLSWPLNLLAAEWLLRRSPQIQIQGTRY